MMRVIDQGYIDGILALEDGNERIFRWICQMIEDRDAAQAVAIAAVKWARQ